MSSRSHRLWASQSSLASKYGVEPLERRLFLSTINWINRGLASDRFTETFGGNASLARGVIDAAIDDWERIIANFNGSGGRNSFDLTLSMMATGTGADGVGGTTSWDALGKPAGGEVELGRFQDVNGDGKGDGAGYYLDPVPSDFTEFDGEILNAFTGVGVVDGQPPMGLSDFYSLAAHEIGHALGYGVGMNSGFKLHTTNTGVRDFTGDGYLYVFNGPSINHLMTSNNAGADAGSAVHSAHDRANPIHCTYNGTEYIGAEDLMNFFTAWTGRRRLIGDTTALILKDSYSFTIDLPQHAGTYYASLDRTTHQLRVRGGWGVSNDTIELSASGGTLTVQVDIGSDVPGTGAYPGAENLPAFVSSFNLSDVTSVAIEAGDGDDTIYVYEKPGSFSLSISGGAGNDTVQVGGPYGNTSGVVGSFSVVGGPGTDQLNYNDSVGEFPPPFTYVVSNVDVKRVGGASAVYSQFEQIRLYARGGGNLIDIYSTAIGTPVTVYAGTGHDTIRVSPDDGVFSLGAALSVVGQGGTDSLSIYDGSTIGAVSYTLTSTSISDNYSNQVGYDGLEQLTLYANAGTSTININSTSSPTPVTVNGSNGQDVITVGTGASGVRWIESALTLSNSSGSNTIVVNDGGDSILDAVVVDDVMTDLWYGRVTGLAPAAIHWTASGTQGVQIISGGNSDMVNVRSTVCPTTISSSGGGDAVTVGAAGTVAAIYYDVTVLNPPSYSSLLVDNRSGIWPQTITHDTVILDGAQFGRIQGLASASIRYKYADVSAVTLYTGLYADTVTIAATGVPTTINNGGATDFVTVGAAGRGVQDIADQLNIENDPAYTALTIDDSGDGTARTASIDVSGAYTYVTGLAPAPIRCDNSDIDSITLRTGAAADTVHVLRNTETTVVTSSGGLDVVNVGNSTNGVQSITGTLTIQNPPSYTTLTVDDSANTTARAMTLDTVALADGTYGRILWLAPAVIYYKAADVYSPITINNGSGADNIMVNATPDSRALSVNAGGGADLITVYGTGAGSTLYLNGGASTDTLDVTETAASGPVFIRPSSGDDVVSVNTDGAGSATAIFMDTQRIGPLSIGSGGVGAVDIDGSRVLTMTSLSIAGSGRLDLADNAAIVDYTGASPVNSIRAWLTSGCAGGAWNGPGINSCSAAITPNRALGYAEATDLHASFPASFCGQSIDSTSVLMEYTVRGDANLSRNVDITDLGILATNWQQSPRRWSRGDFSFDQMVDITDLGILATNWQASMSGYGATLGSQRPAPGIWSRGKDIERTDVMSVFDDLARADVG